MIAAPMAAADRTLPTPELLAPAGDLDALQAALAAGADAVYFGLQEGFNARARAGNFGLGNLGEIVARIHRAGARAYLAVNTLVFEGELEFVEHVLRRHVGDQRGIEPEHERTRDAGSRDRRRFCVAVVQGVIR